MADTLTITPPPEQNHDKDEHNNNNNTTMNMIDHMNTITEITPITTTTTTDTADSIVTPTTTTATTITLKSCESCDHWEKQCHRQQKEIMTLKKDLSLRNDELTRLHQDMQLLNTKYVSAIDRVADIQHEKDLVEHDLEELSCKLFEEANDMVAIEKKEKWLLEKELKTVKQQLMDEKAQLHELRQRLLQWDNEEKNHHHHNNKTINKLKKKKSSSLITTTLKEEDEDENRDQIMDDHEADGDIEEEEDDDDNINKHRSSNDHRGLNNNNDNKEEEEEEEEEDDQFEDAVENLEDPQVRAKHDLALLHGIKKKKNHRSSKLNHDTMNNPNKGLKKKQQLRSVSMPPPPSTTTKKQYTITPTVDQIQLEAFQQFVHSSSNVPLKKLYQFAYIKYCQLEDVEPCLRFGPHSRLSVKKMMDYLLHQPCYIEHMPNHHHHHDHDGDQLQPHHHQPVTTMIPSSVAQRSLIWDRWHSSLTSSSNANATIHSSTSTSTSSSSSSHISTIGCAACGRPKEKNNTTLYYQFRLDEKDGWLPIDQYCRDRLVAVCEFFVFIRNIHLRLYTHRSIDDLYSENIRLRLQMFYSRMGALPVVLEGMGLNADAVGKASTPHDQGYESSGSISSHCPTTPK